MVRKLIWTNNALYCLESIKEFIARDSKYYAATFINRLKNAAKSVTELPYRGRVVPESGDSEIREIFVNDYRIIYKVEPKSVVILAFIHGKRNLSKIWDKDIKTENNDSN